MEASQSQLARERANKNLRFLPPIEQCYPGLPLDRRKHEIRVLQLSPGSLGREIRCALETVSLESFSVKEIKFESKDHMPPYFAAYTGHRPDVKPIEHDRAYDSFDYPYRWYEPRCTNEPCRYYEALSYPCGSYRNLTSVTLNRQKGFVVTDNLFQALRRLRHVRKVRILWVDALCINQMDHQERSWQVQNMGRIYGSAAGVIVWLGELRRYDQPVLSRTMRWYDSLRLGRQWSDEGVLKRVLDQARPLWSERAWVVQEFLLARNKPIFYFGPVRADSRRLDDLQYRIRSLSSPMPLNMDRLDQLREQLGTLSITVLVLVMRDRAATDPRDKVYSVLSLISPEEAGLLKPDYSLSYAEVFTQATWAAITVTKTLHALALVSLTFQEAALPSWAINFTDRPYRGYDGKASSVRWCANSPQVAQFATAHDGLTLSVIGYSFDKVFQVVHVPSQTSTVAPEGMITAALEAVRQLPSIHPFWAIGHPQARQSGLSNTSNNRKATSIDIEALADRAVDYSNAATPWLYDVVLAWYDALPLTRPGPTKKGKSWFGGELDWSWAELCEIFWIYYGKHMGDTNVFFTTQKGFIGMGSIAIESGDTIALLHGSEYAAILRECGSEYTFRGLAHVFSVTGAAPAPDDEVYASTSRDMPTDHDAGDEELMPISDLLANAPGIY